MKTIGKACWWLAGVLLLAMPCAAQIQIGDALKVNLNGDAGFNYTGTINDAGSGHSVGFTGDAHLNGSYYNPNFLNFMIDPYYDRTQSNSVFGTVTNTSGVNANMNLFSGSHFPGSITYSRGMNNSGEFGVPGSSIGLATNGDNQGFAISWSALLDGLPTLTATYSIGDGSSSIYGSQQESTQSDHDLSLRSTYKIDGFRLNGGYTHRNVDGTFSELLEGIPQPVESTTATNNYEVDAQHSFPMSGSFTTSFSRTSYDYSSQGANSSGNGDSLTANLAFHPMTKLGLAFSGNYNDSLLGSLPQAIITNGNSSAVVDLGTFRAFLVSADASYQLLPTLNVHATVNHQQQEFLGHDYGATQFGGNVNYSLQKRFLGSLSFSLGLVDSANQQGNTALGGVGNLNFDRRVLGWDISSNFSYSQNVQTLILVYTTSSFAYVTNARRRLGNRTYFTAGYSGSHSGISVNSSSMSSAQRVSASLGYHAYAVNGFYSTSKGTAAFTTNGLVAIPPGLPPSVFDPNALTTFDSTAYGFNASASPLRRLSVSLGYASSKGTTVDPLLSAFTRNDLINGLMQYKLRKLYLNAGYTRLRQSLGTPGSAPVVVTSYYFGISRWFNFF